MKFLPMLPTHDVDVHVEFASESNVDADAHVIVACDVT